jgi:5-formyltetrahydrofolate cyclo-ligase
MKIDLREEKQRVRKEIARKRKELSAEYIKEASQGIEELLTGLHEFQQASSVFCYVSMDDEPATKGIIRAALDAGKQVAVPRCISKNKMVAKQILGPDDMKANSFGIYEPDESAVTLSPIVFDIGIIPCVTCNRRGERLGHGAGYYDRFLPLAKNMTKCVINFDRLMTDDIPAGRRDVPMDIVLTEYTIIRRQKG